MRVAVYRATTVFGKTKIAMSSIMGFCCAICQMKGYFFL